MRSFFLFAAFAMASLSTGCSSNPVSGRVDGGTDSSAGDGTGTGTGTGPRTFTCSDIFKCVTDTCADSDEACQNVCLAKGSFAAQASATSVVECYADSGCTTINDSCFDTTCATELDACRRQRN